MTYTNMTWHSSTQLQSFFFPFRNLSTLGCDSPGQDHFTSLILGPGKRNPGYKTTIVSLYFFLQIFGGHFGVPIILLTLLIKRNIQRHPLLINFLVTWVLYTSAFCLLLYVGKQFGPEPPVGLCLSQASLIYGAAVMCSSAGLAFVANIWFGINALSGTQTSLNIRKWRDYLLIIVPYVLFVVFTVAMAAVGAAYPSRVTRHQFFFYCTINLKVVDLVPGCSALVLVCVIVLEALIGIKLYRMHKAFVSMKTNPSPPLNLVIRVVVFSIYSILSLLACAGFWSQMGEVAPYIIQASLPTAAFVIFDTQSDLLRAWGINDLWNRFRFKVTMSQASKPFPPISLTQNEGRHVSRGEEVLHHQ